MNLHRPRWACFSLFLNLELFWRNNKTIIEFGFCRIWRILQISEGDNTRLDHRILHIVQKPNSNRIAGHYDPHVIYALRAWQNYKLAAWALSYTIALTKLYVPEPI